MVQAALAQRTNTRLAPSALWCEDCGEQIPEARRQAAPGCECCISCQELRERTPRGAEEEAPGSGNSLAPTTPKERHHASESASRRRRQG
ncbi:TraR/DksA C4-type zinc finger protein [Pseudomonas aeruginosa]